MQTVQIIPVDSYYLPILVKLSIKTFTETYGEQNIEKDMEKYISEHFNNEVLSVELIDERNKFFIAYLENEPVGYLKLRVGQEPNELKNEHSLEIERIYVLGKLHGQKIGAQLMNHCITYAYVNNFRTIWLGVWEKNPKAIHFYQQWGFEIFSKHIFRFGNDDQWDWLMKKDLNHDSK